MEKLKVSTSPHIASKTKTQNIMLDVIIALAPATIFGFVIFGWRAAVIVLLSVLTCVATEYLYNLIRKQKQTINDLSAVVTGLILGLNIPSTASFIAPIIGGLVAIPVVKMLFGGIGKNFANPALVGRIFLFVSFGSLMLGGVWAEPSLNFFGDAVNSGATPMDIIKKVIAQDPEGNLANLSLLDMFIGYTAGVIGETSAVAILIGFLYLVIRGVIDFKGPIIYVATTAVFTFIFSLAQGLTASAAFEVLPYSLLGGGLLFGAVFMATDYATSPNTMIGNIIYYAGCGLFTALVRIFSGMPEGVSFAILFMNLLVPMIDKYIVPKPFGYIKPVKEVK